MNQETLLSIISSLLPILITVFFAWLGSKNEQAKRNQMIEDAKQRIDLISAYVSSQELVLSDSDKLEKVKRIAADELYEIKSFLDMKLQSLETVSTKSDGYFMRFFLLYKMQTRRAAFFRIIFFIGLFFSILWVLVIGSASFTGNSEDFLFDLAFMVSIAVMPAVAGVLFLRWLVIKFDKPKEAETATEKID